MNTLDRIVSMLKQNSVLLEPLALLLDSACGPDSFALPDSHASYRHAEDHLLNRVRAFSCSLHSLLLSA